MKERKRRLQGMTLITCLMIGAGALIFGMGIGSAWSADKVPKEIRIGDTLSMTGPLASFGFTRFGTEAAIEDINKQGGVFVKKYGKKLPIKWITRDTQSDMLKVGPLTEDLILNEKVQILGGHIEPPHMRQGSAVMAEKYKIPALVGVGPFESWSAIKAAAGPFKYTYTWGIAIGTPPSKGHPQYGNKGYLLMETWFGGTRPYIDKTNKKMALAAADDPDGRAWYMQFAEIVKPFGYDCYGADKQIGMFPPGTTDFSSIINEWKKAGCEVLFCSSSGPDFGTLWKQCHTLGFKPKLVFVTRGAIYYRDIESWGGLAHGVTMELYWDPSMKNCRGIGNTTPQSLAERFFAKTKEPYICQGIAFDYMIMQIIIDSIERAGTLEAEPLLKAFGETNLKTTINGPAIFDKATQHVRHSAQLGQWRKTNKPSKFEAPCVFSYNDFMPASAEFIFPIPYDK